MFACSSNKTCALLSFIYDYLYYYYYSLCWNLVLLLVSMKHVKLNLKLMIVNIKNLRQKSSRFGVSFLAIGEREPDSKILTEKVRSTRGDVTGMVPQPAP